MLKARKALQIVVGLLALFATLAILAVASLAIVVELLPADAISQLLPADNLLIVYLNYLNVSFSSTADLFAEIGISSGVGLIMTYVFVFGTIALFMFVGSIIMLTPYRGKKAKHVVGGIFTIASTLAAAYFLFVPYLLSALAHTSAGGAFAPEQKSVLILCICGTVFALIVVALTIAALCINPKKQAEVLLDAPSAETDVEIAPDEPIVLANDDGNANACEQAIDQAPIAEEDAQNDVAESQNEPIAVAPVAEVVADPDPIAVEAEPQVETEPVAQPVAQAEPVAEAQPISEPVVQSTTEPAPHAEPTPATMYIPQPDVTVSKVVDETYGKGDVEQLSASSIAKIRKLRTLYETQAISKDEYIALINKLLSK